MLSGLRRIARGALFATARDWTDRLASSSPALVLAPHPDDETIGCGAVILRKIAAGAPVTVVVVTDGRDSHRSAYVSPADLAALRRVEMAAAAERLGGPEVLWLDLPDGKAADDVDALAERIGALVRERGVEDLFSTCAWEAHPDHAAVGRAARLAADRTGARLFEYPVWLWGSWPLTKGGRWSSLIQFARVVLTGGAITVRTAEVRDRKLHALAAHRTQLGHRPDGVPAEEPWVSLPPAVLDDAGRGVELFLRYRGKADR